MKLYETLRIVKCVSRREEREGENKNTKWKNSSNRYGYMVLYIYKKTVIIVWKKQGNVSSRKNNL